VYADISLRIKTMKYWITRAGYLIKENLVLNEIRTHLRHSKVVEPDKILPLIHIDEIVNKVTSEIISPGFADGDISDLELDYISRIVKGITPKNIFEIGTFKGRTTLNLAANTPKETTIYTLDLPETEMPKTRLRIKSGEKKFIKKTRSGEHFIGTKYENRILQIYSDSASFNYEPYLNRMDFVFIDGSHSYEYVVNDTKIALKLLRNKRGIILWHDYGWREVVQALNEMYLKDPLFSDLKQIINTSFAYIRFE